MATGETREETTTLLTEYKRRAEEQVKYFRIVGEKSRELYGGTPEISLSARAPISHNNFFKKTVKIQRGKVIEGEPQIKVKAQTADKPNLVAAFNSHMQSLYSAQSFSPLIMMTGTDAIMFGGGYNYVHSSSNIEYLYWFDVMIDNAMATPRNLSDGRFVFIRRLHDADVFWEAWKDVLTKDPFNYKDADALPRAKDLGGRTNVGTNAEIQITLPAEKKTITIVQQWSGNPADLDKHSTDGSLDGLVEEWECLIATGEHEDGSKRWTRYLMLDDKLLDEKGEDLEPWLGLPIAFWPSDCLSGQCYQPPLLVDIIRSQAAYNFISSKTAQILSLIDNPSTYNSPEDDGNVAQWHNNPGERLKLNNSAGFGVIEQPVPPQEFFEEKASIKYDLEGNSGVNDSTAGQQAKPADSGVAIEKLQRASDVYFETLMSFRDEYFADLNRLIALYWFDEWFSGAQQEMQTQLDIYKDGLSGEPPSEDMMSYLPPELQQEFQGLTHKDFQEDLLFIFRVVPKLTRDERIQQVIAGTVSAQALVAGTSLETDPIIRIQYAGIMTGNTDEAKELEDVAMQRMQELAEQQAAMMEEQAAMEEEAGQKDEVARENEHERAIEQKMVEQDGKEKIAKMSADQKRESAVKQTGR